MKKLLADALADDPRVEQAIQMILDALTDQQANLTNHRSPDPDLKAAYDQSIEQFGKMRGGKLYYPYLSSGFGNGALVELADGSAKYDFVTGIGAHPWGHAHPDMVRTGLHAALCDTVMQGNLQQSTHCTTLVRTLLDQACKSGATLEHCFLTTSGAMANENALKIIFQKKTPANRILAFEGCFMGRSITLAQITDKPAYRLGLPQTIAVDYVPYFDPRNPQASTDRALAVLKRHLARYPNQHAAMCFELVLGEGGYYPGDTGFFTTLMKELKTNDVPVMIDEVQTFGRTTRLFAFQHFGLDDYADVVTIGKLSQVCATLFTDQFTPKPGLISQTFTGATSSIFAAQKIIDTLTSDGFFGTDGRIMKLHDHFVNQLNAIGQRLPGSVQGPFGLGAMIAFTPFDGHIETVKNFIAALYEAGVIAFLAGANPARVRFLMPLGTVTTQDIDAVCSIIEATLAKTKRS